MVHEPYFFLLPEDKTSSAGAGLGHGGARSEEELRALDQQDLQSHYQELLAALLRSYQPKGLSRAEILRKMDLDAPNHLGLHSQTYGGRPMIKMVFDNVDQLQRVKKEVTDVLKKNERKRKERGEEYEFATYDANYDPSKAAAITARREDPLAVLIDIREHDMPYLVRTCIDLNLRAGCWYTLTPLPTGGVAVSDKDNLKKANPTVLAFSYPEVMDEIESMPFDPYFYDPYSL